MLRTFVFNMKPVYFAVVMAAIKSPAPPAQLNDRQRQYLLAAYTLDQELAVGHQNDYHRGIITPAHEWRGMPDGRWQHFLTKPPTRLRALKKWKQQVAWLEPTV